MASIAQTGASNITKTRLKRQVEGDVFFEMDADIRLGLVLLAEHVYCIDGKKTGFADIPGFKLLNQQNTMKLLGIDESEVKPFITMADSNSLDDGDGKNSQTADYIMGFPKQAKSKSTDSVIDVEYRMPSDLYMEFDKVYGVVSKDVTTKRTPGKGERIIFCGNKLIQNEGEEIAVNGGILSNDGFITDCGFKAGIYERTNEYVYKDVRNLKPPFDGNSLTTAKYILVFSGTDFTSGLADWLKTNINQSLPYSFMYPMQYKLAINMGLLVARAIRKGTSTKDDWLIVGHSLGGGLSCAASVASGIRAVTFNSSGLNRAAAAGYISDLHHKANGGYLSKCLDTAKGVLSLGLLTTKNQQYLNIINNDSSRNKVCAYRGTTDILTSTQDNIHGSKTNVFEYIGLKPVTDDSLSSGSQGTPIRQHFDQAKNKAQGIVQNAASYANSLLSMPTQLPNDMTQLTNSLKLFPSQMATGTSNMLNDTKSLLGSIGDAFTGGDPLKKKINDVAQNAKNIGMEASSVGKAAGSITQQAKGITKRVTDVWQQPTKLYLETLDLWGDVKILMEDSMDVIKNPVDAITGGKKKESETEKKKERFISKLTQSAPQDGLLSNVLSATGEAMKAGEAMGRIAQFDPKDTLQQGIAILEDTQDLFSDIKNTFADFTSIVHNPKAIINDIKKITDTISKTTQDVKKIYNTIYDTYKDLRAVYGSVTAIYQETTKVIGSAHQLLSDPQAHYALLKNTMNTAFKVFPIWESIIPAPIGAALSAVAHAAGEFPPRTYGKRIDVNTEKYIEYTNPENDKYLAYTNDLTGHGLWILLDGFVYNIYDTNNFFVTTQQEGTDNDIFDNVIRRHWRWRGNGERPVRLYHKRVMAYIRKKDTPVSVYPSSIDIEKYCKPDESISIVDNKPRKKEALSVECGQIGREIFIGKEINEQIYDAEQIPKKEYNNDTAEKHLLNLIQKYSGVNEKQQEKMFKSYTSNQK